MSWALSYRPLRSSIMMSRVWSSPRIMTSGIDASNIAILGRGFSGFRMDQVGWHIRVWAERAFDRRYYRYPLQCKGFPEPSKGPSVPDIGCGERRKSSNITSNYPKPIIESTSKYKARHLSFDIMHEKLWDCHWWSWFNSYNRESFREKAGKLWYTSLSNRKTRINSAYWAIDVGKQWMMAVEPQWKGAERDFSLFERLTALPCVCVRGWDMHAQAPKYGRTH